jgi:hypothetical protein
MAVDTPAGDSSEQREAERWMITQLGRELGVCLDKRAVTLPNDSRVAYDGATEDLSIVVEAWAHQGSPKSAQKAKIAKDALKLALTARQVPGNSRRVLLFSSEEAARPFLGAGWEASAIREFGIEVLVRPLPDELRDRVLVAQARQYR